MRTSTEGVPQDRPVGVPKPDYVVLMLAQALRVCVVPVNNYEQHKRPQDIPVEQGWRLWTCAQPPRGVPEGTQS